MKSELVPSYDDDREGDPLPDDNNNSGDDKYKLRPRARRGPRPASQAQGGKSAPLSKYKRRTANARERTRMREINTAFEALRRCVPGGGDSQSSASNPERLTKISTLRLATQYIAALAATLADSETPPCGPSFDLRLYGEDLDVSYGPSPSSGFSPSPEMVNFGSSSSSDFPDFPTDDSLSPFDTFLADFS